MGVVLILHGIPLPFERLVVVPGCDPESWRRHLYCETIEKHDPPSYFVQGRRMAADKPGPLGVGPFVHFVERFSEVGVRVLIFLLQLEDDGLGAALGSVQERDARVDDILERQSHIYGTVDDDQLALVYACSYV